MKKDGLNIVSSASVQSVQKADDGKLTLQLQDGRVYIMKFVLNNFFNNFFLKIYTVFKIFNIILFDFYIYKILFH
jgi:hypothetical protein